MTSILASRILILDFGSQVTKLIARKIRQLNVYCEIHPFTTSFDDIKAFNPSGIILSGGPASVFEADAPTVDKRIFELGLPVLGICYGQQLMCHLLGGEVVGSGEREFGLAYVDVVEDTAFTKEAWQKGKSYPVWMSHGDKVTRIPEGFVATGKNSSTPYAVIADETRRFYGVQFHPEVYHTPDGEALLRNFVHGICGCEPSWSMDNFLDKAIPEIQAKVGNRKVICGLSGGVDSSVVAALLHRAIGDQLHCIFVDTGCLRQDESKQVEQVFRDHFGIPLVVADASEMFLSRLKGVSDPEQKRKIIGASFIDVFEAEAKKIGGAELLAQGTLYPDVIESVSVRGGPSATIKSHHNVGGLPERMNMELIEPLRELFKDEVRDLGRVLGLPEDIVGRHPFPGPGLAIRIPGEIDAEKLEILRKADAIYIQELKNALLYNEIWQAFAALLPVKTVGVMGDNRTYEYCCALRAVTSLDGMTADFYPFDYTFLTKVCNRIIGEVKGINRVVYDVTSKPPATIEWE